MDLQAGHIESFSFTYLSMSCWAVIGKMKLYQDSRALEVGPLLSERQSFGLSIISSRRSSRLLPIFHPHSHSV